MYGKQKLAIYCARNNMKISEIIAETTCAGAIATVAQPLGKMIKRPNPSIYTSAGTKTTKKKKSK